jgi:adenine specific DNA methylase Mod
MDAIKLYRDRVISEHSIGFEVIQSHPQQKANILTELRLWEGSSVTWGANEMARGGMKGVSVDWMQERYTILKSALESGDYQDETYKSIENQLNWLAKQYIESKETDQLDTATPEKDSVKESDLLEALQTFNAKRQITSWNLQKK